MSGGLQVLPMLKMGMMEMGMMGEQRSGGNCYVGDEMLLFDRK